MTNSLSDRYYVYRHIRPDTGMPFYIGIGKKDTKRSISTSGRTNHWRSIVKNNNGEFEAEVLFEDLSAQEACDKEIEFVALYGRINYEPNGILVNVLKGGQYQDIGFNSGKEWSEHVRKKMSESHKGNKSTKGKIYITDGENFKVIDKNAAVPFGWHKGGPKKKPLSEEHKFKLSNKFKGRKLSQKEIEDRKVRMKGNKLGTGTFWITDGEFNKLVRFENDIPEGWKRGRFTKWDTHPEYRKTNLTKIE